jgi:transcriptional regulator GlxA family with amidase domain
LLQSMFRPMPAQCLDWPDRLAWALAANPALPLADWARQQGLAAETISRGFHVAFGITPKRMRYEVRARSALHAATDTRDPLAQIASEAGFADQARMTHAVRDIAGMPPGYWRRTSIAVKTGAA